jgi:hypothetical protein
MEWRSVETAPKDGTEVLLKDGGEGLGRGLTYWGRWGERLGTAGWLSDRGLLWRIYPVGWMRKEETTLYKGLKANLLQPVDSN